MLILAIKIGLVCGVLSSFAMWMSTWYMLIRDRGQAFAQMVRIVYRGYEISPRGCVMGALWGFADGFISGAVVTLLVLVVINLFK